MTEVNKNDENDISINTSTIAQFKEASFVKLFKNTSAVLLGVLLPVVLAISVIFILYMFYDINDEQIKKYLEQLAKKDFALHIVSILILLTISLMSFYQVKEIIHSRSGDINRQRANYIAVMVGLVLTVILIIQPFLDKIFSDITPNNVLSSLLIVGGCTGGWFAWHLKQIKNYGEFFNVLLMTLVTGFCWYARLAAPEQVQITVVAFLLASLFRVAKDYLDNAQDDKVINKKATEAVK